MSAARPRMTRALVLEEPVKTPDGAGGHSLHWQPLGVVWAQISAGSGREVAQMARVTYRITLRAAPQGAPDRPRAGQRLRQQARLFAILAVAEADAEGRYLTCFAQEETAP